jgi:hypothetical protein
LERCRVLKTLNLPNLQSIIDYGLSRGSVLLVLDWTEGTVLPEWLAKQPSLEMRLAVAYALTTTLSRLHELEIAHKDIHPENIVIDNSDLPVIIDLVDLRISSDDLYTTAYLPENYKTLSPFERDRFGLAATLVELLGASRDAPTAGCLPIPAVYTELENILASETLSTLEPLISALEKATQPEQAELPVFTVTLKKLPPENERRRELRHDNGQFHVSVQKDNKDSDSLRIYITGIGQQIVIGWGLHDHRLKYAHLNHVAQTQLLRSQAWRDVAGLFRIEVTLGFSDDAEDLVQHILGLEEIKRRVLEITGAPAKTKIDTQEDIGSDILEVSRKIHVRELWSNLLQAEEESFPTVTIAGDAIRRHSVSVQTPNLAHKQNDS